MKDDLFKEKVLLVVDDEEDLREIISSEFEYCGARVFQAESVAKALEILSQQPIDLIVSDIRMPVRTGVDLLKTVRENNIRNLPIILITGFADLDTSQALSLGAEALVHKPFDMDELLKLAGHLLLKFPQRFNLESESLGELSFYFNQRFEDEMVGSISFGRGGMKIIYKDQPIPIGENRNIKLHFQDKEFSFQGVVRWKRPFNKRIMLGIEFTHINQDMISVLETFQEQVAYIPL